MKGHLGYWSGKTLAQATKQKLSTAFKHRVGSKNPAWKGGRIKSGRYICLWMPDHPQADKKGYVKEHRYVMEQELGRRLLPNELVHHKDGNKHNNNPSNLEVLTWRDHSLLHQNWRFRENLQSE